MALYHDATVSPTKADMLSEWVPTQPWCPRPHEPVTLIGAYRFDDPDARVGMETFLVGCGDTILHVPVTYRDAPLDGAEASLITEMDHTSLGTRWVYDGLADDRYVVMLAAVSLTGQGEALGMVVYNGRWFIAPTNVRITGGGWSRSADRADRVPVDGLKQLHPTDGSDAVTFRNEWLELTVHRHPKPGEQPPLGLTAEWDAGPGSVVLTELRQL